MMKKGVFGRYRMPLHPSLEESETGGQGWEADGHPGIFPFLVGKVEEVERLSKQLCSSHLGLPGTGGEGWLRGACALR